MKRWKRTLCALLAGAAMLAGCGAKQDTSSQPAAEEASSAAGPYFTTESPAPAGDGGLQAAAPGEWRAVWVSYLEWQSFDFSGEAAFTADAVRLMDNCAALGLNTVIAQVRPFADALYPSRYFPWSSLAGEQGQDPGYDPLAILVREAHARGLRLEAWVNPYRVALGASSPGPLADTSLAAIHPDWVKTVGEGLWLDPASEEVQAYIAEGVREIVENYAVDGIQFDDYFYPTTDEGFDAEQYAAHGGGLALADWRRQNVDALVRRVYQTVHEARADCVFGISPQGNNDNNYNGQYSDVARWMSTGGYADYICPQVYWGYGYTTKAGRTDYAFERVTETWAALPRAEGVALYFGLGAYRIGDGDGGSYENNTAQWQTGHALADMIKTVRETGAGGFALYRYASLFQNETWQDLAAAERAALTELLAG